jgi:hypothetical protein
MQELSAGLRQGGLNIFRHRRGMLFVSPIRTRIFSHESAGVSASINAILAQVSSTPGINRKQLSEQLAPAGAEPADLERAKLTLASDLHWLVSEGYVIEFNDGSLDLPRTKPPAAPPAEEKPAATIENKPDATTEVKPTEPAAETQLPVEEAERDVEPIPAPLEASVEETTAAEQI